MRVHDRETHYELGKLRALHDRWINATYRQRGASFAVATDPEVQWHLDVLDALIAMDADEDGAA